MKRVNLFCPMLQFSSMEKIRIHMMGNSRMVIWFCENRKLKVRRGSAVYNHVLFLDTFVHQP